nr:hypothetical protein [Carbonactinospora thermoautotrophica]
MLGVAAVVGELLVGGDRVGVDQQQPATVLLEPGREPLAPAPHQVEGGLVLLGGEERIGEQDADRPGDLLVLLAGQVVGEPAHAPASLWLAALLDGSLAHSASSSRDSRRISRSGLRISTA